uniref:Uncharacterized protein n=1 Tax=Steinernema glaseri TaxID=37863 RepID=A0A1I7Z4U0_9BILA
MDRRSTSTSRNCLFLSVYLNFLHSLNISICGDAIHLLLNAEERRCPSTLAVSDRGDNLEEGERRPSYKTVLMDAQYRHCAYCASTKRHGSPLLPYLMFSIHG